jgi:O-antigen ligase
MTGWHREIAETMRTSPSTIRHGTAPRAAAAALVPPRVERDALRISLALIILFGVSRIHQQSSLLALLRPGLLLTGIAFASAIFRQKTLAPRWLHHWQVWVMGAIGIVTLGSIGFGISQGGAFWYFSNYFSKVLIGAFLLIAAIRHSRDLWMFIWAYVIGAGILVWMALFVFDMSMDSSGVVRLSNLDTWDANDLGVLLLIALPFCMLLIRTATMRGKVVAAAILLGIGAAIARSGSRGAFIGFGIILLAYFFSLKGTSLARRFGMVMVVVLGVVIAAPPGYWQQMNTLTSVDQDYNWDARQGRRQLAIRGMKYMLSYPVFGIGVGNFPRAESTISEIAREADSSTPGIKESAAHNTYVQAGAELGIPGFLLFLTLTIGCVVAPWRLRRRIPLSWANGDWEQQFLAQATVYLPLASIGFAVPAMFVSFAYNDPIYMLAAMTAALSACVQTRLRGSTGLGVRGGQPAVPGGRTRPVTRRSRFHVPAPSLPHGAPSPRPHSGEPPRT